MKIIQTSFKNLKASADDFEVLSRGVCPETGIENRILTAFAFGVTWSRKLYRINWAMGDYYAFAQSDTPVDVPSSLIVEDEWLPC